MTRRSDSRDQGSLCSASSFFASVRVPAMLLTGFLRAGRERNGAERADVEIFLDILCVPDRVVHEEADQDHDDREKCAGKSADQRVLCVARARLLVRHVGGGDDLDGLDVDDLLDPGDRCLAHFICNVGGCVGVRVGDRDVDDACVVRRRHRQVVKKLVVGLGKLQVCDGRLNDLAAPDDLLVVLREERAGLQGVVVDSRGVCLIGCDIDAGR